MISILRSQRAQALVLTLISMTALLGMGTAVLDVGAWYQAHRRVQATADAAALAGAQALPEDAGRAKALAVEFADKNGGGVASGGVTVTKTSVSNDTITVTATKPTPGVFSKLFGINSVKVRARAAAQSANPGQARLVAPITIGSDAPELRCGASCYGKPVTLVALPTGSYSGNLSNFQLVDLSRHGGNVTASALANWLRWGYDDYVTLGDQPGVASRTFNSSEFRQAMQDMFGKELVVLIHSSVNGNEGTAGALYKEIGWAGFVITDFSGSGDQGTLKGYFTTTQVTGTPSTDPNQPYYGVRSISLIE